MPEGWGLNDDKEPKVQPRYGSFSSNREQGILVEFWRCRLLGSGVAGVGYEAVA